MCPDCLQTGLSSFPSWWEYEAFTQQLLRKPLTLLPTETGQPARYVCPACGEVWELSEPEGAWRGYFLPVAAARAYTRKLTARERLRRLGCLGLLLAVALYCGWRWW